MLKAQDRSPRGPAHLLPLLRPACHLYRRALLGPASLPSPPLCRQMSLPRESPGPALPGNPHPLLSGGTGSCGWGRGEAPKTEAHLAPPPFCFICKGAGPCQQH